MRRSEKKTNKAKIIKFICLANNPVIYMYKVLQIVLPYKKVIIKNIIIIKV